ncbi:hypothetical protein GCM10009809_26690 [Isoptericola hypogeus]|uniref:Excisionase family DNA binding protein n=2 Tax=Isoptericola hypogeus TaxID=300179 RepID=A0ABN2JJS5_9MICO
MSLIAVRDAAERLGVSPRQVQHLVAQGELTSLARGVIDSESIDRFLAVRGQQRTRPWLPETAWGAVAILSGLVASWMGETQRSRLKARMRSMSAADLVERTRERADVVQYAGHSSVAERLKQRIVDTSVARSRLGLADANMVDGYVDANKLDELVRRFGLVRDTSGLITLRTTTFPTGTITRIAAADTVLTALDLAGSLDTRERTAGMDALTDALEKPRG